MKLQGQGANINSPYTNVLSSNSNYSANQFNYKVTGTRQKSNLPPSYGAGGRFNEPESQKKVNSSLDQYGEEGQLTPLQQKYLDKLDSIYGPKSSNPKTQAMIANQIPTKLHGYQSQNSNANNNYNVIPFNYNFSNGNSKQPAVNQESFPTSAQQEDALYQNTSNFHSNQLPNLNIQVNGTNSFLQRHENGRKSMQNEVSNSGNKKALKKNRQENENSEQFGNRGGPGSDEIQHQHFEGNSRFPKIEKKQQLNYHYLKGLGNHENGITTDKENRQKFNIKDKYSNYGQQSIFSDNSRQKDVVFNRNQKLNELLLESRTTPQKIIGNQNQLTPIPQKYTLGNKNSPVYNQGSGNNNDHLRVPGGIEQNDLLYSPANSSGNQENNLNGVVPSVIAKFSMRTKAGCTINRVAKTNQDSPIVNPKILADININLFSVCDGHGLNGHLVSQMIKKNLPKNVNQFLKDHSDAQKSEDVMRSAIIKGFAITNNEVLQAEFDSNLSGSTVITAFINERKIYCANVGDSRAIIGSVQNGELKAIPLSFDHQPDVEIERDRVIKNGGRVDAQRDFHGNIIGPMRVWLKTVDMPGLAMTRSFGDQVGVQAGVISEPELLQHDITPDDLFMIVASDGIWEYMSNLDVCQIVYPYYEKGLAQQASEKLLNEAIQVWKRESYARDDITAVVVFFNRRSSIV